MSPSPRTFLHVDAERGFSGGEVQVFLLMRGLARRGHRNVLVCPPASGAAARAEELGIERIEIGMRNDLDWRAISHLSRTLLDQRPDLVHLHTGRATRIGVWAALRAGIPALSTRRMDRRVRANVLNRWIHNRGLARTVAISEPIRSQLRSAGVREERLGLIPSAVDPERIAVKRGREEVRAELGVEPDHVLLLCAGALIPRKGLDVLLAARERIARPDVHLAIAGAGEEEAALRRQAQACSVGPVHWLGRLPNVADYLHACDLFCMPSRREGLGVAALEAMAAGCAVVASDIGGLGWTIEHGESGWLVPPGIVEPLADAIELLVGDPARREHLQRGARSRAVERHSAEGMVAAYAELYERLLAS